MLDAKMRRGDAMALHLKYHLIRENALMSGFQFTEGVLSGEGRGVIPWIKRSAPITIKGKTIPLAPGFKQAGTPFLTFMEKMSKAGDDIPKLATYLYLKDKGPKYCAKLGYKSAEEVVSHYHYTYRAGTKFEENAIRSVHPFYNFMRWNVPRTFELMVKNPRYLLGIEKLRYAYTTARGGKYPEKYYSDMFTQNYSAGSGVDAKGNPKFFLLSGWIAPPSVNEVMSLKQFEKMFLRNLNPVVMRPTESLINRKLTDLDTFGRKLETFRGEPTKVWGQPVPKRVANLLATARIVNYIDKTYYPRVPNSMTDKLIMTLTGKNYTVDEKLARMYLTLRLEAQLQDLTDKQSAVKRNYENREKTGLTREKAIKLIKQYANDKKKLVDELQKLLR
jgi:hypothetical protein